MSKLTILSLYRKHATLGLLLMNLKMCCFVTLWSRIEYTTFECNLVTYSLINLFCWATILYIYISRLTQFIISRSYGEHQLQILVFMLRNHWNLKSLLSCPIMACRTIMHNYIDCHKIWPVTGVLPSWMEHKIYFDLVVYGVKYIHSIM